jgi:hypothetical protein
LTDSEPLPPTDSTADTSDLDPYAGELTQPPRDPEPEPGDPPTTVRGARQTLGDPPGDAADDGARRWDPRTQVTDQREGG